MFLDELVSPSVRLVLGLPGCRCVVVVVSVGNLPIRLLLLRRPRPSLLTGGRRGCFSAAAVVVVAVELERGDHLMFLLLSSFLPP